LIYNKSGKFYVHKKISTETSIPKVFNTRLMAGLLTRVL